KRKSLIIILVVIILVSVFTSNFIFAGHREGGTEEGSKSSFYQMCTKLWSKSEHNGNEQKDSCTKSTSDPSSTTLIEPTAESTTDPTTDDTDIPSDAPSVAPTDAPSVAPTNASSETTAPTQSSNIYNDGVYTGTANGYAPNLTVSVTIESDKIVSVEVGSNNETPSFASEPIASIPDAIVEAQSTDVDIVSGATKTSNGIKNAVADALSKAKI
ncbi:MAG: FMN-binding protein, partial [Clostridiales bacterium]